MVDKPKTDQPFLCPHCTAKMPHKQDDPRNVFRCDQCGAAWFIVTNTIPNRIGGKASRWDP